MAEEFALCWNNYTENITSGFQSLLFQGSLCDVTLAVEGKLLKAHKIVLSICSPYLQEMFITHSHQHPIIILKDMNAKLVSNLLEFMYIGSVNVKQSELQAFMKIAETLQIKGLTTTNTKELRKSAAIGQPSERAGSKRSLEEDETQSSKLKESKADITDLTNDDDNDNDNEPADVQDQFQIIPVIPEISMVESRFETDYAKTLDSTGVQSQSCNLKIAGSQTLLRSDFTADSNSFIEQHYKNSNVTTEIPNEVPSSGSNITMLSSTSLLHGNCIFNRNNTVATQAGLKTYWLCKSYRISMCKARCITHQGKVISATGVHNHLPHMTNKSSAFQTEHSQNMFGSSDNDSNYLSSMSHSMPYQNSQPIRMQPYQYMSHQSNSQMMEHQPHVNIAPVNPSQSIDQQIASPTDESKLAFPLESIPMTVNNQDHFKLEHI